MAEDETPTPFSWVNGRVAALLAVLMGAVSLVNVADGDWLAAVGFGLFAVVMVIQALDDLRWHGRHEPLTGTRAEVDRRGDHPGRGAAGRRAALRLRPANGSDPARRAPDRVEPPGQPAGDDA